MPSSRWSFYGAMLEDGFWPLPLQKEFTQRVAEIREMEAAQAASGVRLKELFQSMLHRAFAGKS